MKKEATPMAKQLTLFKEAEHGKLTILISARLKRELDRHKALYGVTYSQAISKALRKYLDNHLFSQLQEAQ
jgi:hypothetical protein